MGEGISAVLLLHDHSSPLRALDQELKRQRVPTRHARTCAEALRQVASPEPPELIFTDTQLADGNWEDVVRMAQNAPRPVNVIVVSPHVDVRFYVETIQSGAFDFIVPPFEPSELSHVVRCAAGNVATRRKRQARLVSDSVPGRRHSQLPAAS